MAPAVATGRLRKELVSIKSAPPPGIMAVPDESNILKWFYAIRGPSDTPYEDGIYVGKLIFPPQYPMKPPSIMMLTPSGRFQVNTKICMSMSDFHPESWNPMWSVATIIQGVQSFMASDELTTGGMKATETDRRKFAAASISYNERMFPQLFGGDIVASMKDADEAAKEAMEQSASDATKTTTTTAAKAATTATSTPTTAGGSKAAAAARRRRQLKQQQQQQRQQEEEADDGADDNVGEGTDDHQEEPVESSPSQQQLSPEEIEKRRRKNAKKRAKQKAKKQAAATGATE